MNLANYFKLAIDRKASDLHLVEGSVPALRISGDLVPLPENPIPFGELKYSVFNAIDEHTKDRFERRRDMDLSLEYFGNRFRVNLHYQEGRIGLTARLIPFVVPTPAEIGFTDTIYKFTHLKDGLILVTGPSGSGKSTTLAAMIDIINAERRAHIITIEDPIEYSFAEKQSLIEQRQLGRDTEDFSTALKYALRQDPNVIMVGEMRDLDTVMSALTAAKTGHLVLSTLHTSTAPEAVERVLDFFPVSQQAQIAHQLASVLKAVITQQLIPKEGGGLVAAREIMVNNRAIANLIRTNQISQIYTTIQTSQDEGMITMNKSIDILLKDGLIRESVAKNRKRNLETFTTFY